MKRHALKPPLSENVKIFRLKAFYATVVFLAFSKVVLTHRRVTDRKVPKQAVQSVKLTHLNSSRGFIGILNGTILTSGHNTVT